MQQMSFFFLVHPSNEQIAAFIDGGLKGDELDAVEAHCVNCPRCQLLAGGVMTQKLERERSDAS